MSLTSPETIAREYGGNKKKIAEAARMGLLDPTAAVMAGMFIDKMRAAAAVEQTPATTVAQDVLEAPMPMQGMQAPAQGPQGIGAAQAAMAPQGRPMMPTPAPQGQPQMQPPMQPQGVDALPAGNVGNFAGGGIVAFANGGGAYMTPTQEEIFQYYRDNPETAGVRQDTIQDQLAREQATYDLLNEYGLGKVPFYLTEEDKRKNEKLLNTREQMKRAEARREEGRRGAEAARNEFGLPGIMKGPNLAIPFNRPAQGRPGPTPENLTALEREKQRGAIRKTADAFGLPALSTPFSARPEAGKPGAEKSVPAAPKVDAYGLPIPDPEANLALASRQAKTLVNVPTELTQDEAVAAEAKLRKDMGVNENLYREQRETLEKERGSLKTDREEAKNMRILEAGLAIMGGKSPHAFVNIGEGAGPAMKGLAQDIKDIKKADRDLTRAQMALDTAENQYKIDKSRSVLSRVDRSQDRVDKAQQTLATTTATLGNSLNSLSGSKYEAQLRDLSQRFASEKQLEGTMYHADKSLQGSLAHAGASRYATDKDTRMIERIMKEKGVDYTTAYGLMYDARQRDFDRYNSLRTTLNKADSDFQNTPYAMKKSNELSKLDPKKDKARIDALQTEINEAKSRFRAERGISQESLRYLQQEDARLSGQFGGQPGGQPGNQPGGGGGSFIVNTPQGPISFTTQEQADAFKRQYNLP